MKIILLAGGLGTRLREETEYRPKPMVEIGGKPILWHIMKNFAVQGLTEFIVCTGYRSEMIKDYFLNYEARSSDFSIDLGNRQSIEYHDRNSEHSWKVTVVDTGANTMTGGRVKRASRFLTGGTFMVAYGDGLADVDLSELQAFHRSHGRLATVTTVRPPSRFGVMDIKSNGEVTRFREKPQTEGYVNAGFFIFESPVLDFLTDDCVLEQKPLEMLVAEKQLFAYKHDGFWQPMDTYREALLLNEMWDTNSAPWRIWE